MRGEKRGETREEEREHHEFGHDSTGKGTNLHGRKEGRKERKKEGRGRCQCPFPKWEFYSPVTSCVRDISHRYFDTQGLSLPSTVIGNNTNPPCLKPLVSSSSFVSNPPLSLKTRTTKKGRL